MHLHSDNPGRLALPGSDVVLPSAECAATLAHLVVCHAAANAVRVTPQLTFDAGGPVAHIALQLGAQPAVVGLETARRLYELLIAEPPHGDGRLHHVEDELRLGLATGHAMVALARETPRPAPGRPS